MRSHSMTLLLLMAAFASSAQAAQTPPTETAATDTATVSTETAAPKAPKGPDEADELITNRQLRASSGSLSKFSINTSWSYKAGAIDAPFSAARPNITAAGDTAALQSLSGDIGLRYRLNTKDSLSLSIGLAMLSPFHYSLETEDAKLQREYDQNAHKLTAKDPTLNFRHLDKFLGIQSISQVSFNLYTESFTRQAGFRTGTFLSQNFMYELGKSGLSLGTALQATINTFGGDVDSGARPAVILGIYPAIEYVISQRLNLRTVSGVWVNEFRRNGTTFNRIIYQSVGLGISVTRDIFLYPNIQFLPGDLRADKTNLGMTANVNVF